MFSNNNKKKKKIYICFYWVPGSSISNALLLPEGGGDVPKSCLPTDIKQEKSAELQNRVENGESIKVHIS